MIAKPILRRQYTLEKICQVPHLSQNLIQKSLRNCKNHNQDIISKIKSQQSQIIKIQRQLIPQYDNKSSTWLKLSNIYQKKYCRNYFIRSKTKEDDTQYAKNSIVNQFVDTSRKFSLIEQITAKSYCAMIKKTKKIVFSKQASVRRQVASITKLMTALTVLAICEKKQICLSKTFIKIENFAAMIEGTSAQLREGDLISITDLLFALMLPSGNDAAMALAQYFGRFNIKLDNKKSDLPNIQINHFENNIKRFVLKMNKLAIQNGMHNTHYQNPTGLHHFKSYSTANDVATLASICLDNHIIKSICLKKQYTCNIYNTKFCYDRKLSWKNTNKLLWKKSECLGLKTGYTPAAGSCLVTCFTLKNSELIIVLLNSQDKQQRFKDSERILTAYKRKYLI